MEPKWRQNHYKIDPWSALGRLRRQDGSRARSGSEKGTNRKPFWRPFSALGPSVGPKGSPSGAIFGPKSEKKASKNGCQNGCTIYDFSYSFEKGENAPNPYFYNRKRGSGHAKSDQKSIKQLNAKSMLEKVMQK